ncbi:hypothetical protein [Microbacterium sp. cx-59]|uniref:hypothetical protein n=1 Tax=Microbacterium sp. cx-59 TaxID=2891207 RepID=UPI001E51B474|nr:hypothetical protein [Microbacterium sp. cx-59]MCC4909799.1 hypothetical protein [Microbacterium sp. cx-59]
MRLQPIARFLVAAGAAMLTVSLLSLPAHAEDTSSGDGGIGLSVPVIGTTAPTTGGPSSGAVPSVRGSSSSGSGGAPSTGVTTDAAAPEPAASDILIAGGLYLGDVNGSSRPTVNPFEGTTDLWVSLRNLSDDTIDLTADFRIVAPTGAELAEHRVSVTGLKPDETRVVNARLSGAGQWPWVSGRVTIDPPDVIAGQQTAPVTRETVVFVFPWLGLIGLVLVVLALVLMRLGATLAAPAAAPAASGAA